MSKKMGRPRVYDPICSMPGCNKPHSRKGYCSAHYMRVWRHGDPTIVKKRDYKITHQDELVNSDMVYA